MASAIVVAMSAALIAQTTTQLSVDPKSDLPVRQHVSNNLLACFAQLGNDLPARILIFSYLDSCDVPWYEVEYANSNLRQSEHSQRTGPEMQLAELREYASRRGWEAFAE